MLKLEEVSHEMLVFLHPRVLSRVSRFPVASPCLWGKPQNISFSNVSTQVVMSFCMAGVALCDIPTCLMMFTKCQNWRKSSMKCWFFCIHASRLESLGLPVASPCLWGKLQNVSFAKVSNFECTGLLAQWGLRFVKIWQECDYVEGGKLLCGFIQISHSVVYVFSVLCRQTFRLCSIARERQAFTIHDSAQLHENVKHSPFMTEGVYRDIARWWFSKVRDWYASKCRTHGSVADSGMKFDSDVVEDLCL